MPWLEPRDDPFVDQGNGYAGETEFDQLPAVMLIYIDVAFLERDTPL